MISHNYEPEPEANIKYNPEFKFVADGTQTENMMNKLE